MSNEKITDKRWLCVVFIFLLSNSTFISCAKKAVVELPSPEWGKIILNPTAEENEKHRSHWKNKGINHYRYKAKVSCGDCTLVTYNENLIAHDTRLARGISWTIIEVNHHQVIAVKNIDGSANKNLAERLAFYQADLIEKSFEWIAADVEYKFNPRAVIYDAVYGFPRYAEILPSEKGPTDVGHTIEIVEFEILPELTNETKNK